MLTGDVDWPLTKKSLNSAPLTFYLKKNFFKGNCLNSTKKCPKIVNPLRPVDKSFRLKVA